MIRMAIAATVFAILAGCTSETGGHYGNVDDDVYGSKTRLEYTQQSRVIVDMVERMLTDPDFSDVYAIACARAEKRGHGRPTVVIHAIEDNTEVGVADSVSVRQIHKELKTALRKTRKFAVIDLAERARMANIVVAEVDSGAAGDSVQAIGEYEAGDFHMFGELSKENVAGRAYYHFFNLRMIDTVTGNEIWGDTVKVRKE